MGPDGYDRSAYRDFQVMSNELNTPLLLVCPQDTTTKPAWNFGALGANNVTYRLRTGPEINDTNPKQVMVECPVHGNVLLCDGSVTEVKPEPKQARYSFLDLFEFNERFHRHIITSASACLIGCLLLPVCLLPRGFRHKLNAS